MKHARAARVQRFAPANGAAFAIPKRPSFVERIEEQTKILGLESAEIDPERLNPFPSSIILPKCFRSITIDDRRYSNQLSIQSIKCERVMTSVIDPSRPDRSLPPEIKDRSAWYGSDLMECTDWIERLSEVEIAEVESAAKELAKSSIDLTSISSDDFPLPTLGLRLHDLMDEVLGGRGFVLIQTLSVQRWTRREAAIAFLGIGTHLVNLLMQNAAGHLLGDVKDLGRSSLDPNARIYQTRERQTHHTDSCDVVGLLCLRTAKSGGLSSLVSSTTIFNEMRRRRPDLLRVLLDPIETDRRGEVPEEGRPYFSIPVFNWHEGLLSAVYQRQYIESARRFPGVAPLSPVQIEALDLLYTVSFP